MSISMNVIAAIAYALCMAPSAEAAKWKTLTAQDVGGANEIVQYDAESVRVGSGLVEVWEQRPIDQESVGVALRQYDCNNRAFINKRIILYLRNGKTRTVDHPDPSSISIAPDTIDDVMLTHLCSTYLHH